MAGLSGEQREGGAAGLDGELRDYGKEASGQAGGCRSIGNGWDQEGVRLGHVDLGMGLFF